MRFYKHILLFAVIFITFSASAGNHAYAESGFYGEGDHFPSVDQESFLQEQMQDLRLLHEGTFFLLKRYATCEAMLTAMDRGREDQEAYWIGAASLLPGAGQMINQDYLQGSLLLLAATVSFGTVRQLEFTRKKQTGAESFMPLYFSSLLLRNGIMTYAMLHATNKQYAQNHDRTAAMWTGMASMVPGVGQAINQNWWEAGGFFTAWAAATILTSYFEEQIYITGNEGYLATRRWARGNFLSLVTGREWFNVRK